MNAVIGIGWVSVHNTFELVCSRQWCNGNCRKQIVVNPHHKYIPPPPHALGHRHLLRCNSVKKVQLIQQSY